MHGFGFWHPYLSCLLSGHVWKICTEYSGFLTTTRFKWVNPYVKLCDPVAQQQVWSFLGVYMQNSYGNVHTSIYKVSIEDEPCEDAEPSSEAAAQSSAAESSTDPELSDDARSA